MAVDLAPPTNESTSTTSRCSARARAGSLDARDRHSASAHLVELADMPEGEGAQRTSPASTAPGPGARAPLVSDPSAGTEQSSMQPAPRHIAETKLITLRPAFAAPGRSPRSTVRSITAAIPSRPASTAGNSTPAFGDCSAHRRITTLAASGIDHPRYRVTPLAQDPQPLARPVLPLHQGVDAESQPRTTPHQRTVDRG